MVADTAHINIKQQKRKHYNENHNKMTKATTEMVHNSRQISVCGAANPQPASTAAVTATAAVLQLHSYDVFIAIQDSNQNNATVS